jgi:hypothetical protein
MKSLYENNKHHYPDTSGMLDRLFEDDFKMKPTCSEKKSGHKEE